MLTFTPPADALADALPQEEEEEEFVDDEDDEDFDGAP